MTDPVFSRESIYFKEEMVLQLLETKNKQQIELFGDKIGGGNETSKHFSFDISKQKLPDISFGNKALYQKITAVNN